MAKCSNLGNDETEHVIMRTRNSCTVVPAHILFFFYSNLMLCITVRHADWSLWGAVVKPTCGGFLECGHVPHVDIWVSSSQARDPPNILLRYYWSQLPFLPNAPCGYA